MIGELWRRAKRKPLRFGTREGDDFERKPEKSIEISFDFPSSIVDTIPLRRRRIQIHIHCAGFSD